MKRSAKKSFLLFSLFILLVLKSLFAEQIYKSFDDVIPVDPALLVVKMENEFTYYIKENHKPENRIILRLVVNAGSILEEENQRGLAHFLEHMAFNGTKNFPDNSLVDFLEKAGIKFGPDLNAYTSFDSTVYMLDIPSGREDLLDAALLIMFDWASGITNEINHIQKERGVVIEELRKGKGASERIAEVQRKAIFGDSRYSDRTPIGTIEVLENFTQEDVVSFYNDWYRPDLMALIAVGDFDKNIIEKKIIERFSQLSGKESRKERIEYPIANRTSDIVSIVKDSETTSADVKVIYLLDNPGESTVGDYRNSIISSLYASMLNNRYKERVVESDPPFASASAGFGRFVRTKSGFSAICVAEPQNITGGFTALVEELSRAKQHGFTKSEFERAKESHIKLFQHLYLEAANTRSETLAAEYSRNFLEGEFVPGIEYEYLLTIDLIKEITIDEIDELSDHYIKDKGVIILISAPEDSELSDTQKDKDMILEIFYTLLEKELEPYSDDTYDGDLVSNMPSPGKAVLEKSNDAKGILYYKLSNGATLIIKQTNFKNDQVLFSAFSRGGNSLSTDDEWVSVNFTSAIVSMGKIGNFKRMQLDKYLQGKVVNVSPYISETTEGFSGSSSMEDIETLFKLVHLYFNQVEKDKNVFDSYISRLNIQMKNRELSPDVVFARKLFTILSNGNFRGLHFDTSSIPKIDIDTAYSFFKRRFSNPGDFTFIFTGSAGAEIIVPLAEKYLAYLPDKTNLDPAREKMWKDNGLRYPDGKIKETIFMGKEEKAKVAISFKGDFDWNRENIVLLNALTEVADIRLRNIIREDESGTYSISVYPVVNKFPFSQYQIIVYFVCAPERAEALKELALSEIAALSDAIPEGTLMKFKNSSILDFQKQLKDNGFWLSVIRDNEIDNFGLAWLDIYQMMIENITEQDVMKAAKLYFNMESMIDLTMYPEQ
ncbi:MAG: insulinase family protein [Spirochaetaceae bacterium]|nr:insulinase family protein [Spirochaetaceae bacterium]